MHDIHFAPVAFQRVVARTEAMDGLMAARPAGAFDLRIAPDEALLDATVAPVVAVAGDEHAIVDDEHGFAVSPPLAGDLADLVVHSLEWHWPDDQRLGQGLLHNVAVKLVRRDGAVVVVCPLSLAHELEERMR